MKRREVLSGMGALAVASGALADTAKTATQDTRSHAEHIGGRNAALIAAAHRCMAAADACIAHCLTMLGAGDKTLASCAKSVDQMRPMIGALAQLAAQNAPHLKDMAALCAKVCRECEAECKKHEQHPPCMACGEACNSCAAECDKTAA